MKTEYKHRGETITTRRATMKHKRSERDVTRYGWNGREYESLASAQRAINHSINQLETARFDYALLKVKIGESLYWIERYRKSWRICHCIGFDDQQSMFARMESEGRDLNAAEIETLHKILF